MRINGRLTPHDDQLELTSQDLNQAFDEITNDEQKERFTNELELDFAYSISGLARFRVNAALQSSTITLAFRRIYWQIRTIDELGLPEICKDMALKQKGLVLIVGPTGSGKSTTLAAMIEYLNEREHRRIVTIEDPIEYLIRDKKCFITQRELWTDTKSFAAALKHVLRQDPDVILVGEMRDLETTTAAITAAETGHLVLSTLHTIGAAQTIDRIIDVYPSEQQKQIRMQLSSTIQGVLFQTLLRGRDGRGRVLAMEIMVANSAIRNLIREKKTHQIPSVIQTGIREGMQTLDQALRMLYQKSLISRETALELTSNPDELMQMSRQGTIGRVISKR